MPKELGLPVFPLSKDADTQPGDQVVTMGEYVGETASKMGTNYNFMEPETGRHVVLSGGALRWRVEQGHIREGGFYDIVWKGTSTVKKGEWAGKEAHDFGIAVYSDDEVPEEHLKAAAAKPVEVDEEAPAGPAEVTEAMDELE